MVNVLEGIDFKVDKRPAYVRSGDQYVEVPDCFHNVRVDTGEVLGTVGKKYVIVDHRAVFLKAMEAVSKLSNDFEVSHDLHRGKILSRVTLRDMPVWDGPDRSFTRLYFRNGHDGHSQFEVGAGLFLVICGNGMIIPVEGSASQFRGRHVQSLDVGEILAQVQVVLEMSHQKTRQFKTLMIAQDPVPHDELVRQLGEVLTKKADAAQDLETQYQPGRASAWRQFNQFTNAISHDDRVNPVTRDNQLVRVFRVFAGLAGIAA